MGTEEKKTSFLEGFRNKIRRKEKEEESETVCDETQQLKKRQEDIIWLRRILSHNFRMPMAVIAGYGDLLISGEVESVEDSLMMLGKICKNIEYMNTMLKVILDDGNDLLDEKASFDLLGCIREGMGYVKTIARRQGVTITLNSVQETVTVYGNRIKLLRAFYNLIENSLKYMKREGLIHITVDQTEDTIYVIYKDTGVGMNAEEAKLVSEWNYQGGNQVHGYGIGMFMIKETVHDFGGTMEVSSSEGYGMGACLTFPRKDTDVNNL